MTFSEHFAFFTVSTLLLSQHTLFSDPLSELFHKSLIVTLPGLVKTLGRNSCSIIIIIIILRITYDVFWWYSLPPKDLVPFIYSFNSVFFLSFEKEPLSSICGNYLLLTLWSSTGPSLTSLQYKWSFHAYISPPC